MRLYMGWLNRPRAVYSCAAELSSCCTKPMKSTGYEAAVGRTKCHLREKKLEPAVGCGVRRKNFP